MSDHLVVHQGWVLMRELTVLIKKIFFFSGIVVEDYLLLMQNLLKLNVSNQNFFREGRYGIITLLFVCLAFCFVLSCVFKNMQYTI